MPTQEVTIAIIRIGVAVQFATTVLLVLLFSLLRSQAHRRAYFVYWGWGWGLLALGLSALFVQFFFLDGPFSLAGGGGTFELALTGAYQFCKLGFLAALLTGTLDYTHGIRTQRMLRTGLAVALGYALLSMWATESLARTMIWQIPVTAGAYFFCALALLQLPPSRRSLGSRVTGLFFIVFGIVWLGYLLVFLPGLITPLLDIGSWLEQAAYYNAYIDLLLQMLVAFGMILILLEDAKRETEAAHAELALAHQELKAESLRDSLTRALNRRAYNEGAGLEAARAGHGAVIVFDLDNLKDVNDAHGHRAGDALLQYFVKTLRPRLRPTDKLFRFGGDEFLLVMPRAQPGEVLSRFRALLDEAPPMDWKDGKARIPLQVSLGASSFQGGEELDAAVTRADREMYDEKRQHKLFNA